MGESAPSKRAESPVLPKGAITPFKPADPVKPIGGGAAKSGEEKEKRLMDDFDLRCLSIYTQFLERNVEMEITEILSHLGGEEDGSEWGAAFASLTRPKRAATGLPVHPPSRELHQLVEKGVWRQIPDVGSYRQGSRVALSAPPCKGGSGSPHSKKFPAGPSVFGGGLRLLPGSFQLPEEQEADRDSRQSPQAEKQGPNDPDQNFGVS